MRIEFIGIHTKIITANDRDIAQFVVNALAENEFALRDNDVVIIASKVISTAEGCQVKKSDIRIIKEEVSKLAHESRLEPRFVELIVREADEIIGAVPGAVLALKNGVLQANAGADQSNSGGIEYYITLPKDSVATASKIHARLMKEFSTSIGVIIADSKTHPLRRGTSGFALGVSGFSPIIDDRRTKDLFDREMNVTTRALADNLVCGAEILMGESNQQIPIVIARGLESLPFQVMKDNFDNNDQMKMDPRHCIYMGPLWKN
ncbi:MAG: coenzyme F420-0:L-glutamate ligase [Candidatus Hodarchaeales archaeon]|jgi:coenzyme F420-0:L-glutamate ligase